MYFGNNIICSLPHQWPHGVAVVLLTCLFSTLVIIIQ